MAYDLCEQALAVDPNNVRALSFVVNSTYWRRLALPSTLKATLSGPMNWSRRRSPSIRLDLPHDVKGGILRLQARYEEAVAENERALALDPSNEDAAASVGMDYTMLGQFDKSLEYFDQAILGSPHDPSLAYWYDGKARANFGLKQYDQAIELARRAMAIKPNTPVSALFLVAALALTGHEAEAREALQRYLALPSSGQRKTIAAWKAYWPASAAIRPFESNERALEACAKRGCRTSERLRSGRRRPRCAAGPPVYSALAPEGRLWRGLPPLRGEAEGPLSAQLGHPGSGLLRPLYVDSSRPLCAHPTIKVPAGSVSTRMH